ncbi:MAG TPA: hypothetical protein VEH31_40915, partial [Streptosporangiaceae bacterium]|nr:hypothetical protein [Streptosporangiaceae bacterium]
MRRRISTFMKLHVIAIPALALLACRPAPRIDQADVERVLGTLAADSMLGRQAFTPAADRAAAFIRGEFAAIGLEKLRGLSDYLQPFSVYAFKPRSAVVRLNGRVVPPAQTLLSAAADSL